MNRIPEIPLVPRLCCPLKSSPVRTVSSCLVMLVLGAGQAMPEEAPPGGGSPILPEPLTEADFAALKGSSPFGRSIGLSQSLVLTGVAQIENDVFENGSR